ncbi:hypothetical protein B0H15DRAFT_787415, partial [Mycena belliarum]
GLENYVPDDSRETRVLGRYRGRNRFISDYIYNRTGERRSNKQVGSRLQQLRHTSTDPRRELYLRLSAYLIRHPVLHLLDPVRPLTHTHPSTIPAAPADSMLPVSTIPSVISISIPILPRHLSHSRSDSIWTPSQVHSDNALQITSHPRDLHCIAPTVTFLSSCPIIAESWATVSIAEQIVHLESTPLQIPLHTSGSAQGSGFLYGTSLVPSYWSTIRDSQGMHSASRKSESSSTCSQTRVSSLFLRRSSGNKIQLLYFRLDINLYISRAPVAACKCRANGCR